MRKISFLIATFAIVFVLIAGHATFSMAQTAIPVNVQVDKQEVKPFRFSGQKFEVPNSWPSEQEMAQLPMEIMGEGNRIEYAFISYLESGAAIVYWFVGIKVEAGFRVKLLTQTWVIPGYGVADCLHWAINYDGTITEISCDQFAILTNKLSSPAI